MRTTPNLMRLVPDFKRVSRVTARASGGSPSGRPRRAHPSRTAEKRTARPNPIPLWRACRPGDALPHPCPATRPPIPTSGADDADPTGRSPAPGAWTPGHPSGGRRAERALVPCSIARYEAEATPARAARSRRCRCRRPDRARGTRGAGRAARARRPDRSRPRVRCGPNGGCMPCRPPADRSGSPMRRRRRGCRGRRRRSRPTPGPDRG